MIVPPASIPPEKADVWLQEALRELLAGIAAPHVLRLLLLRLSAYCVLDEEMPALSARLTEAGLR